MNFEAIERRVQDVVNLRRVLGERLLRSEYLASLNFSLADTATVSWVRNLRRRNINLSRGSQLGQRKLRTLLV